MGVDDIGRKFDLDMENVAVEKDDGAERLVLGGGGNVLFSGQMGEEGLDFFDPHFFWVTFAVEDDVAFDPIFVCLLGTERVMLETDGIGDLVEEFFAFWGCYVFGRVLHIDLCGWRFYNLLIQF